MNRLAMLDVWSKTEKEKARVVMNLKQKIGISGGYLELSVDPQDILVITRRRMMNSRQAKYLLDDVNPQYESFKGFSIAAMVTSIFSLLSSAGLLWYAKTYKDPPEDAALLFFSFITFVVFLVSGIKALKSRLNLVTFNANNGQRLFSIIGNKPSQREVDEFCQSLAKRIQKIRYGELSSERKAEILNRHVEFLLEQKILNDIEAKSALERISNKSKFTVVNFPKDEGNKA